MGPPLAGARSEAAQLTAVILIGIQGAGKTSFYRERFLETHIHISLDLLGTREREKILLAACLEAGRPFAIDNTNLLTAERAVYLDAARAGGFKTIGYFLKTSLRAAIARNNKRTDKMPLPVPAIVRFLKRLEPPKPEEGFDELYTVTLDAKNVYDVQPWKAEAQEAEDLESLPDA